VTLQTTAAGVHGTWQDIIITAFTVGSSFSTTLNWTATIESDTSGKLVLGSASGTIASGSTGNIALSLSSVPVAGTYTAVVRIAGNGDPATIDVTVNLTVVAVCAGVSFSLSESVNGGSWSVVGTGNGSLDPVQPDWFCQMNAIFGAYYSHPLAYVSIFEHRGTDWVGHHTFDLSGGTIVANRPKWVGPIWSATYGANTYRWKLTLT
jgi:hypothetical protein